MLFKVTYERINWGYTPHLCMTVDVLFESDTDLDGACPYDHYDKICNLLAEQHPSWLGNYESIQPNYTGWSSAITKGTIEKVELFDTKNYIEKRNEDDTTKH